MNKIKVLMVLLWLGSGVAAQKDKVILTIADRPVYKSEFEYVFRKNNTDTFITRADLDDYMTLFINYKLKVKEAEALGMDTAAGFIKELNGYRNQLAAPYLVDQEVNEELIKEGYARMSEEIRASHILFKVESTASPEDTLSVFNEAIKVRQQLIDGGNFVKTARLLSGDPSVQSNNGDLGYFTAFQMVYPFETVAYSTPVGEISMPVRTRFGYHLIKVTDRRPARGEVKVAHIVILSNDKMKPEERENARMMIYEIHKRALSGENFGALAKKYSDDKGSAQKGGELPLFGPGKMVAEFETAAFDLENPGDISEPFTTQYGWHIVKLLEKKDMGTFEELEPTIERKLKRDARGKLGKQAFINARKVEYKFKEYPKNMEPFYIWVDSNIYYNEWKAEAAWDTDNVLFSFAKEKINQQAFIDYLLKNQYASGQKKTYSKDIVSFVNGRYKRFVDNTIMTYEKDNLENKYPEFKALMNEYHDGILLFELSDKKVWSKATADTVGLEGYYQAHRTKHLWPRRINGTVFKAVDEMVANKAMAMFNNGLSVDSVMKIMNADSKLNLIKNEGIFSADDEAVLKEFEWRKGLSKLQKIDDQYVFVMVEDIREPGPKSLDEIRGLMIAEYQVFLEDKWIEELRAKYPYEVNKDVLYSLAD